MAAVKFSNGHNNIQQAWEWIQLADFKERWKPKSPVKTAERQPGVSPVLSVALCTDVQEDGQDGVEHNENKDMEKTVESRSGERVQNMLKHDEDKDMEMTESRSMTHAQNVLEHGHAETQQASRTRAGNEQMDCSSIASTADALPSEAAHEALTTGQAVVADDMTQIRQLMLLNAFMWNPNLWDVTFAPGANKQ